MSSNVQLLEEKSSPTAVVVAVVGYSLCSSTLLLANKMTMEYLPSPAAVGFIQIVFGTLAVLTIRIAGFSVDWFEWSKVKAYALYILIFVAAMYANMQALSHSNVETVIVFRACTPLAVCICDALFMNREYPSVRSMLSLGAVVIGASIYCLSDSQLALNGIGAYSWVIAYFLLIVISMTYGKYLTSQVEMSTVWGPVLYTNMLSIPPFFLLAMAQGELSGLRDKVLVLPPVGLLVLAFSCLVGLLIGYTGWLCRGMVSATSYTLVGVVNKFLTVLLNVLIWDKHSSPLGLLAVCVCLAAGVFYQQAPLRNNDVNSEEVGRIWGGDGVVGVGGGDKELELERLLSEEGTDKLFLGEPDENRNKAQKKTVLMPTVIRQQTL